MPALLLKHTRSWPICRSPLLFLPTSPLPLSHFSSIPLLHHKTRTYATSTAKNLKGLSKQIPSEEAVTKFRAWADELWFAPQGVVFFFNTPKKANKKKN